MKTLQQLKEQALDVINQIETSVEKIFNQYTEKTITVSCNIRKEYNWHTGETTGYRLSGNIEFINENGDNDFGSNISYIYTQVNGLKLNVGTCGEYGKDATYQIERVMMLSKIWSNIEEVETALNKFEVEPIFEFYRAESEHERQLVQKQLQEREAKKQSILESLEVGQVYKDRYDKEYIITKITPKFVTFNDTIRNKKDELVASILNDKLMLV